MRDVATHKNLPKISKLFVKIKFNKSYNYYVMARLKRKTYRLEKFK